PLTQSWGARRLADLILAVRLHPADHLLCAAPPPHLDRQLTRLSGGEAVERIRAREVRAAEHDLLLLHRHGAPQDADLRPGARGVGPLAPEPHGDARRARLVPEHGRGGAEPAARSVELA